MSIALNSLTAELKEIKHEQADLIREFRDHVDDCNERWDAHKHKLYDRGDNYGR